MASERARNALQSWRDGLTFVQVASGLEVSVQRARKLIEGAAADELKELGYSRSLAHALAKELTTRR